MAQPCDTQPVSGCAGLASRIAATHPVQIAGRVAAHDAGHRAVRDLLAALLKPQGVDAPD